MKCLTPQECSAWLSQNKIAEAPYGRKELLPKRALQFATGADAYLPGIMRALLGAPGDEFTGFNGIFGEFEGALLVFQDWQNYPPDMTALINSVRRGHGENRPIIDAPGHLFEKGEQPELTVHCYLTDLFGWTAYLYLGSKKATMLFWEGDLVDVWCADGKLFDEIQAAVVKYKFKLT